MFEQGAPAITVIGDEGLQETDGGRTFRQVLSIQRPMVFNRPDQRRNRVIVGTGGQKLKNLSIGIEAYVKFPDELQDHSPIEDHRGIALLAGQALGVLQRLGERGGAGCECRYTPKRSPAPRPLKSVPNSIRELQARVCVRGGIRHHDLLLGRIGQGTLEI